MQQVNFKQAGLRTKLDVLKPDVRKRVEDKQLNEAVKRSQNPAPNFQIGQNVIARNYRGGDKWVPGIIAAQTGPLSYQVELHQATGVKADIHEEQPGPTPSPKLSLMMRMQGTLTLTPFLKRHPRTTLQIIPLKKNLDHRAIPTKQDDIYISY
jgi:hypothetical protein